MSSEFSPQVSQRICNHMNKDHGNAIVIYAQEFGGLTEVTTAQMVSIDAEGMNLLAQVNDQTVPVRVKFDHVLADAEDAHHTLVAMLKASRTH